MTTNSDGKSETGNVSSATLRVSAVSLVQHGVGVQQRCRTVEWTDGVPGVCRGGVYTWWVGGHIPRVVYSFLAS